ncbi:putative phage replisome organizer [[Clostridium] sordellii]|uniref:phage replisome organizer N-terminal domain-containing protein n=1 Tax=Paraclostridium sordellii TaxID=1505 RepID=UPI0005DE16CD|nr:phage replisome organizer N-terminal domain-containing protein [Paeniclostridium sordellii]CEN81400.1 putative phage replisome organizer [[Clostridium] sordellii] [Paeniclostridium sordellii]CEO09304.1 putative phage replisome organizer [[Clostridium] sordellii] [Paeniclostridium sordellii]
MSDNKKYYYLKLVDNFYERDEMIILESMPDGYMYSNILLKLYLRSLKNEGKLMVNDRIPYNSTMLANVTRFPVAVIEKAIGLFRDLGLIEVLDNGAIYMLDIQNYIGTSSTEADRKRAYRKKIEAEKKALGQMSGQALGHLSQKCPDKTPPETEIETKTEIETELEKDIEIEQHIEKADDVVSIFFPQLDNKNIKAIVDTFNKTKRNIYYLIEKLLITYDSDKISNKTGYIIKALEENYPIRFESTLDKLILVWEDELSIQQDDLTIRKRLDYYKYKYTQEKINRGE